MGAIASQITSLTGTGEFPAPDEFPTQMANNTENVSIWWRHHYIAIANSPTVFHSGCLAFKAFGVELEAHNDALFPPHKNHLLQEQLFSSRKWVILPVYGWNFVCQPLQA